MFNFQVNESSRIRTYMCLFICFSVISIDILELLILDTFYWLLSMCHMVHLYKMLMTINFKVYYFNRFLQLFIVASQGWFLYIQTYCMQKKGFQILSYIYITLQVVRFGLLCYIFIVDCICQFLALVGQKESSLSQWDC